jgi:hypothetical protein
MQSGNAAFRGFHYLNGNTERLSVTSSFVNPFSIRPDARDQNGKGTQLERNLVNIDLLANLDFLGEGFKL